jgi:hypothetical protein
MSPHRSVFFLAAVGCAAVFAACGPSNSGTNGLPSTAGGTGTVTAAPTATPVGATPTPTSGPVTPTPVPTATVSTQQVITMALPQSVMGSTTSAFGTIGGYTQTGFSQTLAFAPGSQVMMRNGQAGIQHTLNVVSTTSFPALPALPFTASGGSTFDQNFTSGIINGGALIGPFTLTAGTYFIGCAFHYISNTMRDVMTVAVGATPGPQATPPGGTATPPPGGIGY